MASKPRKPSCETYGFRVDQGLYSLDQVICTLDASLNVTGEGCLSNTNICSARVVAHIALCAQTYDILGSNRQIFSCICEG